MKLHLCDHLHLPPPATPLVRSIQETTSGCSICYSPLDPLEPQRTVAKVWWGREGYIPCLRNSRRGLAQGGMAWLETYFLWHGRQVARWVGGAPGWWVR